MGCLYARNRNLDKRVLADLKESAKIQEKITEVNLMH
jgi:hypothetical protein